MKTDVLVIGSGVAGLTFAIKIAKARPDVVISVITKERKEVSNTAQAQGGIAVVLDRLRDSFELHVQDTIKAGRSLNDPKVVKMVVSQAPERLLELMAWGTSFDAGKNGTLELGLEGGHCRHRIVHHRDLTGLEIQRKLISHAKSYPNIHFYDHYFVTELLVDKQKNSCTGITALDKETSQKINFTSKITFLASGGSGMVFGNTTNPSVATGDGIAMAWRAGARVKNMNYIQFHPTALYEEGKHPLFLISEAVRGYGAYVVNHKGNRFLFKTDSRGELATRDVVSEAIVKEMKSWGEKHVYLDCRHLDLSNFSKKFPTIITYCNSIGLDLATDLIPVVPAAHYQCGGIEVDQKARTSVKQLYASGECAHTGLHGANRLASNSLLEALVYSHEASKIVLQELDLIPPPQLHQQKVLLNCEAEADDEIIASLRMRLNEIMDYDLLHSVSKREKSEALEQLQYLQDMLENYPQFNSGTVPFFELRNMVQTAMLILNDAIDQSLSKKGIPSETF
ncbi:L-aspartate oxidase [Salinimicrobium sp. TH3]|uniref:L-aspartate oxidase n=1 Tax=Salinimicrobium sp. TH3 TaxID=2997342 RepID=UPI0022764C1B|nr:L-aspartate oxidase [Salinimicrobium sp. TH3]MCY2688663.1 L-aspartate oxidase [Salinimicrobium sp. TH3]